MQPLVAVQAQRSQVLYVVIDAMTAPLDVMRLGCLGLVAALADTACAHDSLFARELVRAVLRSFALRLRLHYSSSSQRTV